MDLGPNKLLDGPKYILYRYMDPWVFCFSGVGLWGLRWDEESTFSCRVIG